MSLHSTNFAWKISGQVDAPGMTTWSTHRNVIVLGASIFCLGLGEEMWLAYMPKYLSSLGADVILIGLFASGKDLLDGLWQYPGGWLTDHLGRKRALMLLTVLAMCGYGLYAAAKSWAIMPIGLLLVMAWKSGAFPTTFAVIGDALPKGRISMRQTHS